MDKENEKVDSPNDQQSGADSQGSSDPVPTEPEVDVEKVMETNKKLFERAKKAEAELKSLREREAEKLYAPKENPQKQSEPAPSVEEIVLLAQGMPEELIEELRAISQIRKTTLIKAQNDPIFVAVKEKFEKEKKQQDASVGASRGASSAKPKRDASSPGLSRDEHLEMFKKVNG